MMVSDFGTSAHNSVLNVISLTAEELKSFTEMWYSVFLWALFSSLFIHIIAALIAFCRLHKHHFGRWIPLAIVAMGIISPLTGGVISSAAIAGVYRASDFYMIPFYALVWGVGQTVVVVVISFSRILATLWLVRSRSDIYAELVVKVPTRVALVQQVKCIVKCIDTAEPCCTEIGFLWYNKNGGVD